MAKSCVGVAPQFGDGIENAYDDADTDLFLNLDSHNGADTCGDISSATGPVDYTFEATVKCAFDANGDLSIPSCRVWDQNKNHPTPCVDPATAGTGSKCDCTPITVEYDPCDGVTCEALDECHEAGVCDPATGECSNPSLPDGTECAAAVGECDNPDVCEAGACVDGGFIPADTLICRDAVGGCDLPEYCDGEGACPADSFVPEDTLICRDAVGGCDLPEYCDGEGACPADSFVPEDTLICRDAVGGCELPEYCDGEGSMSEQILCTGRHADMP